MKIRVLRALLIFAIVMVVLLNLFACTTNHYFSVNAEEMTNPKIEYHDSTSVTKPW